MEPAVHLRAAVSLLGRFPALAGVDLDVARGEIVLVQGPNGAGKTHPPAHLGRPAAGGVGRRPRCSATTCGGDRRAVRRQVGLLGHATMLYDELTVADNVRFWARAAGPSPPMREAALEALGLGGRLRHVAVGRLLGRAAPPRRPSPCSWPAAPSCGCSTSPTPASTPRPATLVDELVRGAVRAGATVLVASHELERSHALAGRVVTIAGGVIEPGGPRGAAPAPRRDAERRTRPG